MVGNEYWSTGITLKWNGHAWTVWLDFYDDGFADDESTEGTLKVRYTVPTENLGSAIDMLLADSKRLGISFRHVGDPSPQLYVPGDGLWKGELYHPEWKRILAEQAARIGWSTYTSA